MMQHNNMMHAEIKFFKMIFIIRNVNFKHLKISLYLQWSCVVKSKDGFSMFKEPFVKIPNKFYTLVLQIYLIPSIASCVALSAVQHKAHWILGQESIMKINSNTILWLYTHCPEGVGQLTPSLKLKKIEERLDLFQTLIFWPCTRLLG